MDVPLVNRATTTAPKDYDVPNAQEILLKAVRASIDGSSATSGFLPALQLISDAGDVMWTSVNPSAVVAAGGSANVTWFPGLGGGGSGLGGGMVKIFFVELGAGHTSIDTLGTSFSNYNTEIFGMFQGASTTGAPPDLVRVQFNGSTGSNHSYVYMNATTPGSGAVTTNGQSNNLVNSGVLGIVSAGGGDPVGAYSFWIARTFSGSQDSSLNAYGGWGGLQVGTFRTDFDVGDIHRLTLTLNSGAAFTSGTTLTLWSL